MRQKIAVFDIDGTLFRWQLDHAVMVELEAIGAIRGFRQALGASYGKWKNREHPEAFKDYTAAFDTVTARYLKAVPLTSFNQAADNVIRRSVGHVYMYTRTLIAELKAQGYAIAAISGSLQEVVEPFARAHGFDAWRAQTLGVEGGHFVAPYGSMSPEQKVDHLYELIEKYAYATEGSVGVGDTLSDAAMLEVVEHPIVFNPNRQLMRHAMQRNWKIVIERKNAIYQLTAQDGKYGLEQTLI